MDPQEQSLLIQIVGTWEIKEVPEYRGFRCAYCQEYKNEAWYHWVNTGGFKLPIHLCNDNCEPKFQNSTLTVDSKKYQALDKSNFGDSYTFSPKAIQKFQEIVSSWPEYKAPELKAFTCDLCEKDLEIDKSDNVRKGYHVWYKMPDTTLVELHFHRACAQSLEI